MHSTVLRLHFHPRFETLGITPRPFETFLRAAFAQKRKTLRNNLQSAGHAPDSLTAAWPPDLQPQIRAEQVSLEQMAALFRGLAQLSTSQTPPQA